MYTKIESCIIIFVRTVVKSVSEVILWLSAVIFACILPAKFKKSYFNALISLFIKF